jgi:hypothetical protein
MLAQVSPVVRPLLATVNPVEDTVSPLPAVHETPDSPLEIVQEVPGGAAGNVPPPRGGTPSSKMAPVLLTVLPFTCAMAASTLVELELSGSHAVKKPTSVVPEPSP